MLTRVALTLQQRASVHRAQSHKTIKGQLNQDPIPQSAQRQTYSPSYVGKLFDSIAHRYDLLNHVLSFGLDFHWRRRAVRHLRQYSPAKILDVATGTADLAIAAATLNPQEIVGVDISQRMLERGKAKVERANLASKIRLERGSAESLPFDEGTFDATMVAFGARNFSNLEQGLREMYRVLAPGGVIIVLEFSTPRCALMRGAYRFYSRRVLPRIGGLISRNKEAYEYLPATVNEFPYGKDFADILRTIGFLRTEFIPLSFGIATIYTGHK